MFVVEFCQASKGAVL